MASVVKREHSKFWYACFTTADGRRLKKSTKATDRKTAQKIADHFEEAANRKRTASQMRKVMAELHKEITDEELPTLTVRDFIERWIGRKENSVSPATLTFYKGATNKLIESLGGKADEDIGRITRDDITAFRDREAARVAPKTANHNLKCARMLFKDAMRDTLIPEDPTQFVETVRSAPTAKKPTFSLPQLRALIDVADDEWRSLIYFGLYTGQRLGDLSRLTWDNVDLQRNEIRFVTSKTGKALTVVIAEPLRNHIEALPAGDKPNQPLHPRAFAIVEAQGKVGHLSNQFSDLLASVGLREKKPHRKAIEGQKSARSANGLSFHSLRRTATTLLHEAKVPAAVAQSFIGHDSEEMHQIYVSVGREALTDAAATLPDICGTEAEEKTEKSVSSH